MLDRYEMRFSGSGGQGVILASVILAEAAVLDNKVATQSQSYGPEARGGLCKAETVISNSEIFFTKVTKPNFLLALTQASFDKYRTNTSTDAIIVIDNNISVNTENDVRKIISLPIINTARDVVGKVMTANIVAIGAINSLLGLFDDEVLFEAVKRHIPKGTEELNNYALSVGKELISPELQKQYEIK